MIFPTYKFELTATLLSTTYTRTVHPLRKDDLAIDFEKDSDEQYFRGKLSGKLKFVGPDYDWIAAKDFETEFELKISISYDGAQTWSQYWKGKFYKTNCEWDADNKIVTVTPTPYDVYADVLAGMEKEFDLIKLTPEISHIKADKRPLVQIYSAGDTKIGCFLSGMYWEQDCNANGDYVALQNDMHFAVLITYRYVTISGAVSPADANGMCYGTATYIGEDFSYQQGGYIVKRYVVVGPRGSGRYYEVVRASDNVVLWSYSEDGSISPGDVVQVQLNPVQGSGASGTVTLYLRHNRVCGRYLMDAETFYGTSTFAIPSNDIVTDHRNYSRCYPYTRYSSVQSYIGFSSTPTKYGLYQPGQYYAAPYSLIIKYYPVCRSIWSEISLWFHFDETDITHEIAARKQYTLRDAFPLASVISRLLSQFAPNVNHAGTAEYSQFLYANNNPLTGAAFKLFLTQKSNILTGNYDQPAQKAPATLKQILDMLRSCFRLYWFIDTDSNGNYRFRIEHIFYFLNGGSYSGEPIIGLDLTELKDVKNGKPWAYLTSKYSFDKVEMPERYEFGWMDNVSDVFDGFPINISSKFVESGNIEKINVSNFTSDIDYMLTNPAACDNDGFALLAPVLTNGEWVLPYLNFESVESLGPQDIYAQNAYLSFTYLQIFYLWDLPAYNYTGIIYEDPGQAYGTKKQKSQEISFPCYEDVDMKKLIKTNIGNGQIQKLSLNLSSRKAKCSLKYDTV